MRVIAVDDEKLSLRKIERIVSEIPGIDFVAGYTDPLQALEQHKEDMPDVAFLDVEMPEMDGLTLSERLAEINPKLEVVFVTAHDKYALAAYQNNAIGYLLKPVQTDELSAQINRIRRYTHKSTEPNRKLYFKVFGSYYIIIGENEANVLSFRTAKSEELLAFMLSQNGKPVSRDVICETLWPEMDIDKGTRNFHTTAYNIRHTFQEAGLSDVLLRSHNSYRLNPNSIQSDQEIVDRAYNLMEKGIHDITIMESALNIYQGEYMADKDYLWLMDYQSSYERIFEKLSLYLCDYYIQEADYNKAEIVIRRLMDMIPFHEDACDRLIAVYLASGQNRKAKKLYESFRILYREEIGEEPILIDSRYKKVFHNIMK